MHVSEYDLFPPDDSAACSSDDAFVVSLVLADGMDKKPLRLKAHWSIFVIS